jgi:hypothetical protein
MKLQGTGLSSSITEQQRNLIKSLNSKQIGMEISLMKRLKRRNNYAPPSKLEGARIQPPSFENYGGPGNSGVRSQKKTLPLLILISILLAFTRMPPSKEVSVESV